MQDTDLPLYTLTQGTATKENRRKMLEAVYARRRHSCIQCFMTRGKDVHAHYTADLERIQEVEKLVTVRKAVKLR
jgi:hypothetical protein